MLFDDSVTFYSSFTRISVLYTCTLCMYMCIGVNKVLLYIYMYIRVYTREFAYVKNVCTSAVT